MAIVNELITKFGFIGDLAPQETFNANLKSSIGLLAGNAGYRWRDAHCRTVDGGK
ncbi:TPA: hypothetical protein ACPZRZ_003918 [Yersinia enterocolitica]